MNPRIASLFLAAGLALPAVAQRVDVSYSIDHELQRTTFRFDCWGGQLAWFALFTGDYAVPGYSFGYVSGLLYLPSSAIFQVHYVMLDASGHGTIWLHRPWKPLEHTYSAAVQGAWGDERGLVWTANHVLIGQRDDVANGRPLAARYHSESQVLRFGGRLVAGEVIEVWRRHSGGNWVRVSVHKLTHRDFDISTRIAVPPGSEIELRTAVTPATLLRLR